MVVLFRTYNPYYKRHVLHTPTCGILRRVRGRNGSVSTFGKEQVSGRRLREVLDLPNVSACNCIRGLLRDLSRSQPLSAGAGRAT